VKFLVDTLRKEKFLQAYGQLKNSDNADVQRQNIKALEQMYGKSHGTIRARSGNMCLNRPALNFVAMRAKF
jgi:hypothetical protein